MYVHVCVCVCDACVCVAQIRPYPPSSLQSHVSLEKSVSQYHHEAMELQLRVDEATHKCEDAERRAEEAKSLWDMEAKTRTKLGLKVRWAGRKRLGAGLGGTYECVYCRQQEMLARSVFTCTYVQLYIQITCMYVYVCTVQLCV